MHGGLGHLAELVDVVVLDVLLVVVRLIVLDDEPQPAAEEAVLRVHVIRAVRSLGGDLVGLAGTVELGLGGRHRLAKLILHTLQVVVGVLRVLHGAVLVDGAEDRITIAGEVIALRLDGRIIHPAIALRDTTGHFVRDGLTGIQRLAGHLRADGRLEILDHLELDFTGLGGRIGILEHILTGGVHFHGVNALILDSQMHGAVLFCRPRNVFLLTRGDAAVGIGTCGVKIHHIIQIRNRVRNTSNELTISVSNTGVDGALPLALRVLVGRLNVVRHVQRGFIPELVGELGDGVDVRALQAHGIELAEVALSPVKMRVDGVGDCRLRHVAPVVLVLIDHKRGDLAVAVGGRLPCALTAVYDSGLNAVDGGIAFVGHYAQRRAMPCSKPAAAVRRRIVPVAGQSARLCGQCCGSAGEQCGRRNDQRHDGAKDAPNAMASSAVLVFHGLVGSYHGYSFHRLWVPLRIISAKANK